ncbi:MAG: MucBP domain-containing protein [Candidatus Coprovivens sp.]
MKKKGKVIASAISVLFIITFTIFNAFQIGKAEDTSGKITLNKTAVATSDRKAKVTLEIQTSELKQSTADIIFVLDHSSSMNYDVCTKYEIIKDKNWFGETIEKKECKEKDSRLAVAKAAAIGLVEELIPTSGTGNVRVGFISFGTYYESDNSISLTNNRNAVEAKINSLTKVQNNGTNIHAGLKAAQSQLASSTADTKIVIVLSDGKPTFFDGKNNTLCGDGQNDRVDNDSDCKVVTESGHVNKPSDVAEETATSIKSAPISAEIYAIGFGESASDIADFLTNQIASTETKEKTYAYSATDTDELKSAFSKIASSIKNTLATNATVTDTIPASFKLTDEAKNTLLEKYGNDIIIIDNEDGTTTIKVKYDEISSVQGTYTIEYEVEADEDHYGAMYTNVAATFEATATEDNTYYQNKNISLEFNKPVVAISKVTEDDDYSTNYIVKEGNTITIQSADSILNNDSTEIHTDKPTGALTDSSVTDEIVIENNPTCGTISVKDDGTFTYTSTEGCAGENSQKYEIKYHVVSKVTIDGTEYEVTSNTSTITIKVEKNPTSYTVKYLEEGTNKELASSKLVTDKYVFDNVTENAISITGYNLATGQASSKTIKLGTDSNSNVITFYYTIKPADIENPTFTKDGPDSITTAKEAVDYTITYETSINDYKGNATITIVDELPYTIDTSKSSLAGGTYNATDKTITWTETVSNIDTYTNGPKDIKIEKEISVYYNYPEFDGSETIVSNTATSKVEVSTAPDKEKEITEDTPVDIKGKLVVKYLYQDAEGNYIELTPTQPATEAKIGTPYSTTAKTFDGYTLISTPSNATGKYKEGITTVIYYYERVAAQITDTEINKTAETKTITSSKDEVTYTITYDTTIKDYNGPVTITIVDTLPFKIDETKSNLAGGTYDETSKTIKWEIKKSINTYADKTSDSETISGSLEYTVVYKDLDATLDEITNKVNGTIEVETTDPEYARDEEKVPVNINGTVITYHKDSEGNTLSSNVTTTGKVGTTYQTSSVTIPGYELYTTPSNSNGKYIEGTIEVTYIYKRLGATPKNPVVTKTGTTEITNSSDKNEYTITYDAIVENYKGNITVTIVDTLPYELDETKVNNLDGGTYNSTNKTITWTETFSNNEAKEKLVIDITKSIQVYYKNIDASIEKYTNKVSATLEDDLEGTPDSIKEATHDTNVNIKGKVITHYYLKDTTTKLIDSITTTDKVGNAYQTEAKNIEGYELVATPDNYSGKYTEEDIIVIYEYTRKIAKIDDENISKNSTIEEITSSKTIVDYQIVYTAKITDYKGTATVKIVDYLPYAINSSSDLDGGIYDATNKTITWTETINGINTFQNGQYSVNITKNIKLIYNNMASDKEVVNKVEGQIKTETNNSEGKEAQEKIIANIKGDLIVKHIYKDSDGNEKILEIETKTDYVGYTYTTEAKKFNGYTLSKTPDNKTGEYKEETTIVMYYYDRIPAEVKYNEVSKKATNTKVTSINDAFNYTIKYKTELNEYEGKAVITIVDALSHPINVEKSSLADGIYNEETLTITWKKEYDVNTYNQENSIIELNYNITIYYENLNPEERVIVNNVKTKLELETIDPITSEDKTETDLEVKGKVIIKYYDKQNNEIIESDTISGLVGEAYKTSRKEIEGYVLADVKGNEEGRYIDGTIEVIYIYEKEGTGSVEPELPPETKVDNNYMNYTIMLSIVLSALLIAKKRILN